MAQDLSQLASSPFSEQLGRHLVEFVRLHFFGLFPAATDSVDKIVGLYPQIDPEIAKCLTCLSNWYVHDQVFEYRHLDRDWTFSCSEQVMMALKVAFFEIDRPDALEIMRQIEDAPREWRRLSSTGELRGLYQRCWPGLVKHIGRSLRPSDPTLLDSYAASFTRANKEYIQAQIQQLKYSVDARFRFVIDTVRLWNFEHPADRIYLLEATAGDVHYSINADFFSQLLPSMRELRNQTGSDLRGEDLCNLAMANLLDKHASLSHEDRKVLSKKSFEHGVAVQGDDCLGKALRLLVDECSASAASMRV